MFDNKDITKREYINGVIIEYGKYTKTNDSDLNRLLYLNSIKFYDEYGNEFYANFENVNDAYAEMYYLLNRGVNVVLGPKAPIKDFESGEITLNYNQDGVALYIVKNEKKELVRRKH